MHVHVSEENSLHIRHHAFSRPFHAKIFVPRCQRRYFKQTLDRSHYPNGMIACGLCFIWQTSFVKNYSACCSGILSTFFTIDSYRTLKISLNHRNQTDVPSLKDFSKNPYTFTYFCHHTAIYSSAIDLFVLTLVISFITRTFSPSARSFPHPISLEELLN